MLSYTIQHYIGTPATGVLPDLGPNIHPLVVESHVGAQGSGYLELCVGAAGNDCARTDQLGDLESSDCYAPTNPPDEYRFSRPQLRTSCQHTPRRQRSQRERGCLRPGHVRRRSSQVLSRDHDVLGNGPGTMLAEHPETSAKRFLGLHARHALAAGECRIDHHPVAGPPSLYRRAYLLHDSRRIRPDDMGKSQAGSGKPHNHEQIQPVEGRRAHLNQDIIG
jgi:hypothetical protein